MGTLRMYSHQTNVYVPPALNLMSRDEQLGPSAFSEIYIMPHRSFIRVIGPLFAETVLQEIRLIRSLATKQP